MNEKYYYVYIISNWNNRVMYIGVTNNLERRIYEHRNTLVKGFSSKYNLGKLLYFEETTNIEGALIREKELKKFRREKKINLILGFNPNMNDLYEKLFLC